MAAFAFAATSPDAIKCVVSTSQTAPHGRRSVTIEIVEYALPSVEEDQPEARPAIAEPEHEDDAVVTVTPEDTADSSILKKSGAPAGKRRRVFDDRVNVAPLGPLPAQRPLGPAAHEVWFGCPKD